MSTRLHFERGEIVGELEKTPLPKTSEKDRHPHPLAAGSGRVYRHRHSGGVLYGRACKRQAVVNAGITFRFRNQTEPEALKSTDFSTRTASQDYVTELAGEDDPDRAGVLAGGAAGPGPGGQAGVQGEALAWPAAFPTRCSVIEHYHNSSLAGARRQPGEGREVRLCLRHRRVPAGPDGKYQKNESKITWQDVEDCLVLVSNNFSTQTSYENQTKKAITNKFVQEAMTEFLRHAIWRSTSSKTPSTRRRSPSRC